MTFELQLLIKAATEAVKANPCDDGDHDWSSDGEGGRPCPTGCDMCSQTVYRCRSCGAYDYGDGDREVSPSKNDCQAVCGDSMTARRSVVTA